MSKYLADEEKAAIKAAKRKNREFIDTVVVPRTSKARGKAQISYEEAKSLIAAWDDGYNACIEYEDGWNFYKTASNGQRDGGGVVITKDTGEKMYYADFLIEYEVADAGMQIAF